MELKMSKSSSKIKSKSLPWDIVEKAISQEIKWLKNTISVENIIPWLRLKVKIDKRYLT